MRRKSERTPSSKKAKASPEKKIEKVKRTTRSRRKKQSTSSENESPDDASPVREAEPAPVVEETPPKTPVKEDSPEEAQDQVWRVKAAAGSGDTGEIQKLKICLTRPPTTPERVDRSPRSKRKHSRATSSSDTPSVEAPDEKRKTKHRSKRSHRESKDEAEKTHDEEPESDSKSSQEHEKSGEATQSESEGRVDSTENTISTSNEETKSDEKASVDSTEDATKENKSKSEKSEHKEDKASDADTTVVSPKAETTVVSATPEPNTPTKNDTQDSQVEEKTPEPESPEPQSPTRRRSASVDKSEILELHPEEIKVDSDTEADKSKDNKKEKSPEKTPEKSREKSPEKSREKSPENTPEKSPEKTLEKSREKTPEKTPEKSREKSPENTPEKTPEKPKEDIKVSQTQDKTPIEEPKSDSDKSTNKTGVVENSKSEKRSRNMSTDSGKDQAAGHVNEKSTNGDDIRKSIEQSDSTQPNHDETLHNGQAAPIVVSRKRRWGSRPSKIMKQKSITISTDVLKDIIPDVKPVEFEEVIEEKKHKRVVTEKIERPILPKIVIDNSENVQRAEQERNADKKDQEEKDGVKTRDIASNRKISIIKDDSIITRPLSPPRHKQSHVLYITNLVRPFTLPQLKNLLQRTGRLVENGFWIDKIKSKCFVIYETEDQAVETRHALHGVTWPVSNPKTLQVDFSTQEAFDKAKSNEDIDNAQVSTIAGTVEDWLREQDMKRERGEVEKPWERKTATREWDLGKNDKDKDKERLRRDERPLLDKRRHRTPERSPEPARKFKKKEEEAPAKLLDDLFKKTKATPCIYWLPLSAETIAVKEEQRRQHMAEHERRMKEQRRTHHRH